MSIHIARPRLATSILPNLSRPSSVAASTRLTSLASHLTRCPPSARPFSTTSATMSAPSTMKSVTISKNGGADELQYSDSNPVPKPTEGQVLIKNDYAGINYIDTYFRTGLYPAPRGFPLTLGQEGVGEVVDANGDKTGLKNGDRVVWMASAGYAEYTAVPAGRVVKVPQGVDEKHALGGFLMGMTALSLVQEAYPVKKGDKVLVHAAAGAMGLLICQLLRDMGAYTIGTAGSPERCQIAKDNGANECIDYNANPGEEWVKKVKDLTNGQGVNVVYDSVGKTTWQGSLDAVARKGKVVYWGSASGPVPPINIAQLATKNTSIMRATVMQYVVTRQELEHYAHQALDLIKSGKLNIKIHKIYDLKDAKQAHEDLEGRKTSGKLLLKI